MAVYDKTLNLSNVADVIQNVAVQSRYDEYIMFESVDLDPQFVEKIMNHLTFAFSPSVKVISFQFCDARTLLIWVDRERQERLVLGQSFAALIDRSVDPSVDTRALVSRLARCGDMQTVLESIPFYSNFSSIKCYKYQERLIF